MLQVCSRVQVNECIICKKLPVPTLTYVGAHVTVGMGKRDRRKEVQVVVPNLMSTYNTEPRPEPCTVSLSRSLFFKVLFFKEGAWLWPVDFWPSPSMGTASEVKYHTVAHAWVSSFDYYLPQGKTLQL